MSARELVDMIDGFVTALAAGRLEIPATADVVRSPRARGGETLQIRNWLTGMGPMTVLTNADGQPTNVSASLTEAVTLRAADLTARFGPGRIMVDDDDGSLSLSFDLQPAGDRHHVVLSGQCADDDEDRIVHISAVPFQTET